MNEVVLQVICTTTGCPNSTIIRNVHLESVAVGVVARPTLLCSGCLREMKDHQPERIVHD